MGIISLSEMKSGSPPEEFSNGQLSGLKLEDQAGELAGMEAAGSMNPSIACFN
jgi:hypothetical protein